MGLKSIVHWTLAGSLAALAGCSGETGQLTAQNSESCMLCHNGSPENDYSGPGIENPHPFTGADNLTCTACHGGNPDGEDMLSSHVPPPPQIGDDQKLLTDRKAYFNRLTLAGIDKFPDYTVDGRTYTALEYLQFINPGDLRVVTTGQSCGACHQGHADCVDSSLLATSSGIYSGAMYQIGADNKIAENQGLYDDTAADLAFRAVLDAAFTPFTAAIGQVGRLIEAPVYSKHNVTAPDSIFNNPAYFRAQLLDDIQLDGKVVSGSPLEHLYQEQVAFTCGDCHLGSAGANNRAGDFRSSGCSACHMPYSLGGKSGSSDPNINKLEPLDPDDIDEPERPHARSHRIHSVAKTLPSGVQVPGIDDLTCAGCHQGSNRTVLQYWGIRLDQNQDVVRGQQYPANPVTRQTTHNDARLYNPAVGNHTFNGRNANQYLAKEDYDGDGRDDTPEDVHHEAGMGCIDCHGSFDIHGGDALAGEANISSRMSQQVAIRCESCHGTVDAYAPTVSGTAWDGVQRDMPVDGAGNPLKHVHRDASGHYFLRSRLTGATHYIPQTKDTVVENGRVNPLTNQAIYSAKASYAMGRADSDPSNGIGPMQTAGVPSGFAHTDRMDCVSCHASWTNTCMGCHLSGEYDTGNNFSNVTGDRIVYKQRTADFTYQSPLFFTLGVGPRGKITQFSSNTKVFYHWQDKNNEVTPVMTFSDRHGRGSNPAAVYPSLSHNAFMAHSIRGRVTPQREGPRYCATCHLTDEGLATWGNEYTTFRNAMSARNYAALDFNLLKQHFGRNTGNTMNSPLWPHMAAGLGSGLFLFDENGCPVNPLDNDPNRRGCYTDLANLQRTSPQTFFSQFGFSSVAYDLDRIVEASGVTNGSNNHPWLDASGATMRDGALDANQPGPLGAALIRMMTDPAQGRVLDSWIDSDGQLKGDASNFISGP